MAVFEDFWARLNFEMVEFVLHDWWDFRDAAVSDGRDFLEKIRAKTARWCVLLGNGTYSREDFRWLLTGLRDQANLTELRRRGLPQVELDRFTLGIINIIAHTAFNFFAPENPFGDATSPRKDRWKPRDPEGGKKHE